MKVLQKIVLALTAVLLVTWLAGNFAALTGDRDGIIRFVLGLLFSLLIIFRWKREQDEPVLPAGTIPVSAVLGAVFAVGGLIFRIHQFEWLGLILVLYACLSWSLPPKFGRDILLSLFLLYWIHPLPGNIFGDMQLGMQALSVQGAEKLLHCFNQRIWADGAVLRGGFRAFEVAESCSGLRTAVTVFLCTIGVGILFHLRWFEIVVFSLLGLLQVLILNILRITFMVMWAARKPPEWSGAFLHDTLGIFLLVSILLVQMEMSWWKFRRLAGIQRRRAMDNGDVEQPEAATMLPRFWFLVAKWGWVVALIVLVAGAVSFVIYKQRPAHRAAMIAGVVEGLITRDPDMAERAIDAAQSLGPPDRELASREVQILILRDRCADALRQIDELSPPLTIFDTIMKSWALMGMGRADEAIALIDALPESTRNHPAVAVIQAEYAARQNQPDAVGRHVAIAAQSHVSLNRARRLFPYLAMHEQWVAITRADNPNFPFIDFAPALVAVHAHLEINDVGGAAEVMKQALRTWPHDSRFLSALYLIAANRPGSEWEVLFEDIFRKNVATMDADRLASCINYAFELNRPELAWMAYLKLRSLDPSDPALFMAPARFGDVWFTFRKHQLGLETGNRFENMDLRPFIPVMRNAPPFRSLWDRVPLADELAAGNVAAVRKRYLDRCIDEIQRRDQTETLPQRIQMMYPSALGMAGRYQEAHSGLDQIGKKYPGKKEEVIYQHALLYDQEGKWQDGYEELRTFYAEAKAPNLTADLLMVKALMNLNLGVGAMHVAERARKSFPGAYQLNDIISAIWSTFGFKEEALFVLTRNEASADPVTVTRLLYDTGRYREAEKAALALNVRNMRRPVQENAMLPPPAEHSLAKKWPEYLADADLEREQRKFEQQESGATSPFMRAIGHLGVEWYKARGQGAVSDPVRWRAAGRDTLEKALALNWLTMVLACHQDYARARGTAGQAVELLPESAMLWRVLMALSEDDSAVVRKARAACPDDPEIWLASLVTRAREEKTGDWALREVQSATNRFSVETLVRAGDFLLRKGMVEPASLAAKDAINRGHGLVSPYVLGLSCALTQRDMKWAQTCTSRGADLAKDPTPFYKVMVDMKSSGKGKDADVVAALEYLQERFRNEPRWAEKLGEVYFTKGDNRRAFNILTPLIEADIRKVGGQSLLLAAEAARQEGRSDGAVSILESAYKLYPDKVSVLNNLVYSLVEDSRGLKRAMVLLPRLLEMGGDSPAVLDTVAKVYMKNGQLDLAARYMEKALKGVDQNGYAAQEISLNAAEVMFRMGDYEGAKLRLERIRRDSKSSSLVDVETRELLTEVEKAIKEKKR